MTTPPKGTLGRIVATGVVPVVPARRSEEAVAVIEAIRVGGVSLATVGEFIQAGASAVGAGAGLVDVERIRAGDPAAVTEKARRYVPAVARMWAQLPPAARSYC